jgi:hypothetical protein
MRSFDNEINAFENNLIMDVLWELAEDGTKKTISNPKVLDLAYKLKSGVAVRWSKEFIQEFLTNVQDVAKELEKGKIEKIKEVRVSIYHETDSIKDAYKDIEIKLHPFEIPITKMTEFTLHYGKHFSGPHYPRKSKFTSLIEYILAQAIEKKGVTIVAGAGIDPYIPTGETLTRFATADELRKYLVVFLCAISTFLPPSPVTKILCKLVNNYTNIDIITSNWSFSLERNKPIEYRFCNVRKIIPKIIDEHTISLTFGALKEPHQLSQHMRKIGEKNVIFCVGSSLRMEDFGRTGLGEHMSNAGWILIFTLTNGSFHEKLRNLTGRVQEVIPFIEVIDDLHSIFNYIRTDFVPVVAQIQF